MARSVLVPLPDRDFDVTEVAVPWKLLSERGVDVVFATEEGEVPTADPTLLVLNLHQPLFLLVFQRLFWVSILIYFLLLKNHHKDNLPLKVVKISYQFLHIFSNLDQHVQRLILQIL